MDGYTDSTYGDAFADVYDDWYRDVSDVEATVNILTELAAEFAPLPVLELGVGTGRLAVPLAARGVQVVGLDASAAMLAKLAQNDPAGSVAGCIGDMVDDQPAGPFALAFVAYNTFFNLRDAARQQACFAAVAERLSPGGAFVIEAFVPEPQPGSSVVVRSMTVDSVVLSVATHDDAAQTAQGQYISFSESGGVRLRPWAIRYATVDQLDDMASASGFRLAERWEDSRRTPFGVESSSHITVYRTIHSPVRPERGQSERRKADRPKVSCRESTASESPHWAVGNNRGRACGAPDRSPPRRARLNQTLIDHARSAPATRKARCRPSRLSTPAALGACVSSPTSIPPSTATSRSPCTIAVPFTSRPRPVARTKCLSSHASTTPASMP